MEDQQYSDLDSNDSSLSKIQELNSQVPPTSLSGCHMIYKICFLHYKIDHDQKTWRTDKTA